jgi:adenine-specific DNA-methyltransferase
MGSKYRLLPWIHEVLARQEFNTALDAFSGSGCVAYLMKSMGKQVTSNDFLHFTHEIARATVENSNEKLTHRDVDLLCEPTPGHDDFIEQTFTGIFFTSHDLEFLDQAWHNIDRLKGAYKRSLAISALVRACVKRQPRGVFTVAGDPSRYKDGRRDLNMTLREHFRESARLYNKVVFDNGMANKAIHGDVFAIQPGHFDLVYLDPPYVPRADDNCYIKRYHFLEGLSYYWRGAEILNNSRVRKLKKLFTPFSYRRTAIPAFERLFEHFAGSQILLSYSSNGFPDLQHLVSMIKRHKEAVEVHERPHRYHFGTHSTATRNEVTEYLIFGR